MKEFLCEVSLADLQKKGYLLRKERGAEILIVDSANGIRIYNAICPHLAGPLLEGKITPERIVCPWHELAFDASTGKCLTVPGKIYPDTAPATQPFSIHLYEYPFEVNGDNIRIFRRKHSTQNGSDEDRT